MASSIDKPTVYTHKKALIELHLAAILFGGAGLFAEFITISAGGIVLGRALIAAVFIAVVHFLVRPILVLPKSKKDRIQFVVLGFILALHWVSFFVCIQMTTVAIGVLTFSSFPIFTILLVALMNKRLPSNTNILLSLVALFGIGLLLNPTELQTSNVVGVLVGIFSGFTCAILTIYSQRLLENYSGVQVAFYQNGIAALFLVPFYSYDIIANTTGVEYLYFLFLGIALTAIAHTLFINSMERVSPQTASLVASLEPVYGIVLAWLLLHQVPTWSVVIGGVLILGVAFVASMPRE